MVARLSGMATGLIAARAGGWTEAFKMTIVDLQLSFKASLVELMMVAALGKGVDKIILALTIA